MASRFCWRRQWRRCRRPLRWRAIIRWHRGFAGRAYLFYGPFTGDINAADADAIISAEAFGDNLGISVASAGDVNNDGVQDIIIGAPRFPLNGADTGRVYIFYGPVSGSMIATEADVIIFGEQINDDLGVSVAPAGMSMVMA